MDTLTQHELQNLLDYSVITGVFTWKVCLAARAPVGAKAGCKANGYIQIRIKNKLYYAHRLAFLHVLGVFPKQQIDHINGNRSDNSWINLREVSSTLNQQNAPLSKNNTSTVVGVLWDKRRKSWLAKIGVNSKELYLGAFKEFDLAVIARKNAEQHYGYHPNHGRKQND